MPLASMRNDDVDDYRLSIESPELSVESVDSSGEKLIISEVTSTSFSRKYQMHRCEKGRRKNSERSKA